MKLLKVQPLSLFPLICLVGVDYVLHTASPVPNGSEKTPFDVIDPAIKGTVGLLESALKEPRVKHVVYTSSCVYVSFVFLLRR